LIRTDSIQNFTQTFPLHFGYTGSIIALYKKLKFKVEKFYKKWVTAQYRIQVRVGGLLVW
jgi:hypothetical protein